MTERIPPHNEEAEKSVLGSMLLSADAVLLAMERLYKADFYFNVHQEIFDVMRGLHFAGKPVDLVTCESELSRRNTLSVVGGLDALIDLSRFVPATANVGAYIDIVAENSTLRRLIDASGEIMQESYDVKMSVPAILDAAEKRIYDITMQKSGNPVEHIQPVLVDAYEKLEYYARNKGGVTGVASGYAQLDRMTTGFGPGQLILIAARPSMGKSALALNIAQSAAVRDQKTVAIFSLEMGREDLVMRMLCSGALVDMQKARQGTLSDDDWMKISEEMAHLSSCAMYIDDTAGISVAELRSRCRRLQMEKGLDMIVIDYLQLMSGSGSSTSMGSRQLEVSEISRGLKALALELKVPVIALSQLSRAPQARMDHRPMLSDLRDSGAIEQDADVVMFIYREAYYNKGADENTGKPSNLAEIILAKQRNGPTGTVELAYAAQYTRFMDIDPRSVPAGY